MAAFSRSGLISSGQSAAMLEQELMAAVADQPKRFCGGPVFILGAPRTGSTMLYQAIVAAYALPYISNLANQFFSEHPIIGLWLQAGFPIYDRILGQSQYGKVEGVWQPSEASAVMTAWFGGGHPSELVSTRAMPRREAHFRKTIDAAHRLFGRPLVIKNAWNCFRLSYLREALPESAFIWIRRDLKASACSDLHARYAVHGDPTAWNSATPRNWKILRRRPYWQQVVENQVEFSRAISDGLTGLGPDRFAEVWYEDLCAASEDTLIRLSNDLVALQNLPFVPSRIPEIDSRYSGNRLTVEDEQAIEDFVTADAERLAPFRYTSSRPKRKRMAVRGNTTERRAAMHRVGQVDLSAYLTRDWIGELLAKSMWQEDLQLACQRWLAASPGKRLIFSELYGDLLEKRGLRILDVGGGLTSLTRQLATAHNYALIDFMTHDPPSVVEAFLASAPEVTVHGADWSDVAISQSYDVVIANDLFPNVDQRLGMFLDKVLPNCREVRLSLTFYNEPRHYRTKRDDADEILTVQAWNGQITQLVLDPYLPRIHAPDMTVFGADRDSIFPNRRQICLVTLSGDQADT